MPLMSQDKPVNRRRFFREGLREMFKSLAEAAEPLERAINEFNAAASAPPPRTVPLPAYLRPPGALFPDNRFTDTCSRCGKCVEVCPANCIVIDPSVTRGGGAPFIDPLAMPCVVCEGLQCMQHCPTGAIQPIPLAEIDMGTARWNPQTCVRNRGDNCTICVDKCPLGSAAIRVHEEKIQVIDDGCIGCGICQHECPTWPRSITVIPRSSIEPAPG